MGGNVFKEDGGSLRIPKLIYFDIRKEVYTAINVSGRSIVPCTDLLFYQSKTDFGDMDILYTYREEETISIRDNIIKGLKYFDPDLKVSINGNVTSVLYKRFQLDLIYMSPTEYKTAYFYYSYNDLGNLLGKIYHKLGLKFGHKGLVYPLRTLDTHLVEEVKVSTSEKDILNFIGLSYDVWGKGFYAKSDIFNYVISSPYFSPEIYDYENLNHANRVRDRKRATYHEFLEYIKNIPIGKCTFAEDKNVYLPALLAYFPGFKERYEEAKGKLYKQNVVKKKFNGELVGKLTGFTGIELGGFIKSFKDFVSNYEPFEDWVYKNSEEDIYNTLVLFFERKKLIENKPG